MALSKDERKTLIGLLEDLSPAQLSTLVGAVGEPNSRIGTSTESANFALLKKLCEFGIAEEVPLEVDLPPNLQAVLRAVLICESAKPEIAKLLAQLTRGPDQNS